MKALLAAVVKSKEPGRRKERRRITIKTILVNIEFG
jgi:hypothetical protein